MLSSFSDDIGNLIGVNLALGELTMKLTNIYGPNIDCPSFYANLHDLILTCEQDYVILWGDLNLALEHQWTQIATYLSIILNLVQHF